MKRFQCLIDQIARSTIVCPPIVPIRAFPFRRRIWALSNILCIWLFSYTLRISEMPFILWTDCISTQFTDHGMVSQILNLNVSTSISNQRVPCDQLCLSVIRHRIYDRIKTIDFCISTNVRYVTVIQKYAYRC